MKFEEIDQVVLSGKQNLVKTDLEQTISKYHDLGYCVSVSAEATWDEWVIYTVGVMKMVDDGDDITDGEVVWLG